MYGEIKNHLMQELSAIQEAGLLKKRELLPRLKTQ